MKEKELECQIFGPQDNNFDKIEVNSWIVEELEDVIKVEAERVYYKDEKIINKKSLPFSIYKMKT